MGKFRTTTDVVPAVFKEGERFAQLLILPVPDVNFIEAEELSESERKVNGFGSTGEGNIDGSALTESLDETSENKAEMTSQEATPESSGGEEDIPEQA